MNKYGSPPKTIGHYTVETDEMFFYQYLPIKMKGSLFTSKYENRLKCFDNLIFSAGSDFIEDFGIEKFMDSYVYLTAKRLYQSGGCYFNRVGWHSDGFMTDDINYIWSDKIPTIFNLTSFKLSQDDNVSMLEMDQQADLNKNVLYENNTLLRLDQYNIHKVNESNFCDIRTFVKISISSDKYDLKGNSKNYNLDYDWIMRDRKKDRNIPQKNQ